MLSNFNTLRKNEISRNFSRWIREKTNEKSPRSVTHGVQVRNGGTGGGYGDLIVGALRTLPLVQLCVWRQRVLAPAFPASRAQRCAAAGAVRGPAAAAAAGAAGAGAGALWAKGEGDDGRAGAGRPLHQRHQQLRLQAAAGRGRGGSAADEAGAE